MVSLLTTGGTVPSWLEEGSLNLWLVFKGKTHNGDISRKAGLVISHKQELLTEAEGQQLNGQAVSFSSGLRCIGIYNWSRDQFTIRINSWCK